MGRQTVRWIVVLGWLGALGALTTIRCAVWQTDAALWADALITSPEKPRVVMNDARTHELAGDVAYADRAYREVIYLSFDPRRSKYVRTFSMAAAETNLAHLAMKEGRMASAMRLLEATLSYWPEFPYAHYNKGSILWVYGACEAAWDEIRYAQSIDPMLPNPKGECHDHPHATP